MAALDASAVAAGALVAGMIAGYVVLPDCNHGGPALGADHETCKQMAGGGGAPKTGCHEHCSLRVNVGFRRGALEPDSTIPDRLFEGEEHRDISTDLPDLSEPGVCQLWGLLQSAVCSTPIAPNTDHCEGFPSAGYDGRESWCLARDGP